MLESCNAFSEWFTACNRKGHILYFCIKRIVKRENSCDVLEVIEYNNLKTFGTRRKHMTKEKIAILGASGAVGREMIRVLIERGVDSGKIFALGGKSAGSVIEEGDEKINVSSAEEFDFSKVKYVLGAVSAELSRRFAPRIKEAGAVFIDNSSAFRLDGNVPLVVPGINGDAVLNHRGIISNPNCSTIISLTALAGINRVSPIKNVIAVTYQAVSGAGTGGMTELKEQTEALLRGDDAACRVFPHRIVENVIPWIGNEDRDGYTDEEMKMQNEGRKIFGREDVTFNCTCVRVPVMRSHSIALTVYCESAIDADEARKAISRDSDCVICDDAEHGEYPMPILSSGRDEVFVGRIRNTLDGRGGISLFCCGDQLRRGAATNAIDIVQLLER